MPTPSIYTYSIATDTANGVVEPTSLKAQILATSVAPNFNYLETGGDVLLIHTLDVLSGGDQTTLTQTVNAHDGRLSTIGPNTPGAVSGTPVYIASTNTFTIPRYTQAVYSIPIVADGIIAGDGVLVEVQ